MRRTYAYSAGKLLFKYYIMNNSTIHTQKKLPLLGKDVLLVGNDTAVLQRLVIQLAQKGADTAVLCWEIPLKTAHWLKEQAQKLGRRLYFLEQAKNQDASVDQLVNKITTEWGPFDVFIDVSAKQSRPAATPHPDEKGSAEQWEQENNAQKPLWRPEQWHLTQVVLEEMVRS